MTTFAQLRKEMEEAQRRAEEQARREAPAEERGQEPKQAEKPEKEVEVDFDVKKTGETKSLAGFNTSRSIMTITVREKGKTLEQGGGMVMTTDMWLAPTQKSLDEIAEFDERYAEKLYGGISGVSAEQMAMAVAMYPMMADAIEKMKKEDNAFEGTPIMTTVTFEAVKSAEQMAADSKQEQPEAKPSIGGMLGGLAKRIKKPSADEQKPRASVMTSTMEVLKIAPDVADADLAIPAGFKENK